MDIVAHSCRRGKHTIDDELVFSSHTGYAYAFHDSRGIESGNTEELKDFIHHKCGEKRLLYGVVD